MELQRKIQTLDSAMAAAPEIDPDLPEELRAAMAAERGQSAPPKRPANSFISGRPASDASICILCSAQAAYAGHDSSDGKGSLMHGSCQLTMVYYMQCFCGNSAYASLIRRALCFFAGGARRGPRPPFPPRQNPSSDAIVLLGEGDGSMHADQNGSSSAQAPPGAAPKQAGTQANAGEAQKKEDALKSGTAKVKPVRTLFL